MRHNESTNLQMANLQMEEMRVLIKQLIGRFYF